MTEDEAKTKWCPFGRLETYEESGSANIYRSGEPSTFCMGSKCMAWQKKPLGFGKTVRWGCGLVN